MTGMAISVTTDPLALIIGAVVAFAANLHILASLGLGDSNSVVDRLVTGVFISAGATGFNSVMKFLGYAKEQKKADAANAAASKPMAAPAAAAAGRAEQPALIQQAKIRIART